MRARHAKHIEAYCRHIAEERHVAGRLQGVVGVGAVQSGSHQAQSELGVGAVVGSAYDAEVEPLVLLLLVGVVKVVEQSGYKTTVLDGVGGVVGVLYGTYGEETEERCDK